MKKLLFFVFLAIFGCTTMPQVKQQPIDVCLTVKASDKVQVQQPNSVNRNMSVENPEGSLSQLSFVAKGNAFIKIFSGISTADVVRMWNDLIVLEYQYPEIREVSIFINSPGGDAFSGLAIADEIVRAINKGFKIKGYASGIVASAAVPILAVCNERYASSGTIFMVHEAQLWKWPGRETASDIRSQNDLMSLLGDRYRAILANRSRLSASQWKALEEKTTWFDVVKALEYGLIDSVE